jgi:hypothetical protein
VHQGIGRRAARRALLQTNRDFATLPRVGCDAAFSEVASSSPEEFLALHIVFSPNNIVSLSFASRKSRRPNLRMKRQFRRLANLPDHQNGV